MERVGRHDNFFDLGGHSLLVTRLSSRINDLFDLEIQFQEVFIASSLLELAFRIDERQIERFDLKDVEGVERDLLSLSEDELVKILENK